MKNKLCWCLVLSLVTLQANAQKIRITGTLPVTDPSWNNITILVWDDPYTSSVDLFVPHRVLTVPVKKGRFSFTIDDARQIIYFSLGSKKAVSGEFYPIIERYPAESTDSIHIVLGKIKSVTRSVPEIKDPWLAGYSTDSIRFAGRGALKCRLLQDLEKKAAMRNAIAAANPRRIDSANALSSLEESLEKQEAWFREDLAFVQAAHAKLSSTALTLLKATVIGKNYEARYGSIRMATGFLRRFSVTTSHPSNKRLLELSEQSSLPALDASPEILAMVPEYLDMILTKARMLYTLSGNQSPAYYQIRDSYTGVLRDKAICSYFLEDSRILSNLDELLKDAFSFVQTSSCIDLLKDTVRSSTPGMPAYDFALSDTRGNMVRLADLKGKVVFVDFWYTGCGACSSFYKRTLVQTEKAFEHDPGVVFVTISIDRKKEVWLKSVADETYTSAAAPNVINLYTGGMGINHDIIKWYKVKGYPQQLLIDKQGKIYRASNLQLPPDQLVAIIKGVATDRAVKP